MGRYKTVKVNGVSVPEHRVIWEKIFGPIPEGCVIHHVDGNGRNNRLDNLMLMTQAQHKELHARLRREGVDPVDANDPKVIKSREHCKHDYIKHRDRYKTYRETHKEQLAAYERSRIENHHERELERYRVYRETHREECRARTKAWGESHKAERKAYREAHKELIAAQGKAYREAHSEERAAWQREYYAKHKEHIAEYHKAYAQANREKIRAREKARSRTPEFRAHRSAYEKLRRAIQSGKPPEVIAKLQSIFDATKTKK